MREMGEQPVDGAVTTQTTSREMVYACKCSVNIIILVSKLIMGYKIPNYYNLY